MCGLKFYTDQECGNKGQPSAVSEQSSSDDAAGSNMTSKKYPNVATRSLFVYKYVLLKMAFAENGLHRGVPRLLQ